jgi:hypothetical protein
MTIQLASYCGASETLLNTDIQYGSFLNVIAVLKHRKKAYSGRGGKASRNLNLTLRYPEGTRFKSQLGFLSLSRRITGHCLQVGPNRHFPNSYTVTSAITFNATQQHRSVNARMNQFSDYHVDSSPGVSQIIIISIPHFLHVHYLRTRHLL